MEDDTDDQGQELDSEREIEGIAISLTPSQIGRVVRKAAGTGNVTALLAGRTNIEETLAHKPELLKSANISRSLLIGLIVLCSVPSDGSYIGVVDLSRRLGKSASTTHRYLATLVEVGLVEQNRSRGYRLAR
jgi:DNA-binding transcriptional ArsR family regulator